MSIESRKADGRQRIHGGRAGIAEHGKNPTEGGEAKAEPTFGFSDTLKSTTRSP